MSSKSQHEDRVRRRVIYHGRVQGVGFRYTTVSIARRFPVKGYVKNLPGGTVEVVADGPENSVREFLEELEAAFEGNIRSRDSERLAVDEEFRGFEVRYA